jgi:hypothetical protein
MGLCKDCKYAKYKLADGDYTPKGYDYECLLGESKSGFPVTDSSKAFAQDTEFYHAYLCVTADFGCVQFEEK